MQTENHATMLKVGCLPCLFRLLGAPGLAVQRQAAAALKSLCANVDNKPFIADNGGIPAIISLLRAQDVELQTMAAGALRHLSLHLPVKTQFVAESGLPPLFEACKIQHEDLQLQCAGALANLSENTKNQTVLGRPGRLGRARNIGESEARRHHAAHGARVRERRLQPRESSQCLFDGRAQGHVSRFAASSTEEAVWHGRRPRPRQHCR